MTGETCIGVALMGIGLKQLMSSTYDIEPFDPMQVMGDGTRFQGQVRDHFPIRLLYPRPLCPEPRVRRLGHRRPAPMKRRWRFAKRVHGDRQIQNLKVQRQSSGSMFPWKLLLEPEMKRKDVKTSPPRTKTVAEACALPASCGEARFRRRLTYYDPMRGAYQPKR